MRKAEQIFRPAWALAVPLNRNLLNHKNKSRGGMGGDGDGDSSDEEEDERGPPLVPTPGSLLHPLYPGYGNGRFCHGSLIQTIDSPLPYNIAVSRGTRRPFVPKADGTSLFAAPPRKNPKRSPYSLHALENNICQLPITEDQLRQKFAELDANGLGYLHREQFKKLYASYQSYGLPHTPKELDELFSRYAPKKSNRENEIIRFDEFAALMLRLAQL